MARKVFRRFWHLVGGAIGTQLITIVAAPVLLRFYSPEEFGQYSLCVAVGSLMAVALAGRLDMAIALPASAKMASRVSGTAIFLVAIGGSISLIVAVVGSALGLWGWITSCVGVVIGVLTSIFQIQISSLSRKREFQKVAGFRMMQSVMMATFQILIAWKFQFSYGMEVGCVLALSATVLFMLFVIRTENIKQNLTRHRNILIRYRNFWRFDAWSALLNSISSQLPVFLLGQYFAGSCVGYYSLSQRILVVPMGVIGSSVAQIFYQEAAEQVRSGGFDRRYLQKSMGILFLIGVAVFVPVVMLSKTIIDFAFGVKWTQSAQIITIISPWLFVVFVVSPFSGLFQVLGEQQVYLISNVALFIMRATVFVVVAKLTNNWISAILAYSLLSMLYWVWVSVYLLFKREACSIQSG